VSGAPNPTQAFATTFPVTSGGTPRLIVGGRRWGVATALSGCIIGAVWTLLW
jgi:hypothetical protein